MAGRGGWVWYEGERIGALCRDGCGCGYRTKACDGS